MIQNDSDMGSNKNGKSGKWTISSCYNATKTDAETIIVKVVNEPLDTIEFVFNTTNVNNAHNWFKI